MKRNYKGERTLRSRLSEPFYSQEDGIPQDIYPFGSFCRRGNYCIRCGFECKQRKHAEETRKLFEFFVDYKFKEKD